MRFFCSSKTGGRHSYERRPVGQKGTINEISDMLDTLYYFAPPYFVNLLPTFLSRGSNKRRPRRMFFLCFSKSATIIMTWEDLGWSERSVKHTINDLLESVYISLSLHYLSRPAVFHSLLMFLQNKNP
jgi:hypothetical protein